MDKVTRVNVDREILQVTNDALRKFGTRRLEGFAVWVGSIADTVATVEDVLVPPQTPIRSEDGVGYLVDGSTLIEVNKLLHREKLRLIGQVHSHPGRAYHSKTDDLYAIAIQRGSLSVVVPNFAAGEPDLLRWAVYRIWNGEWVEQTTAEIRNLFGLSQVPFTRGLIDFKA